MSPLLAGQICISVPIRLYDLHFIWGEFELNSLQLSTCHSQAVGKQETSSCFTEDEPKGLIEKHH